jgi:rhodanese-related sulfurtransferase
MKIHACLAAILLSANVHAQVLKQRSGSTEQVLKQQSGSTEQVLKQQSGSTEQVLKQQSNSSEQDPKLLQKIDALYRVYADELKGVPEISAGELRASLDKVLLVDVRETKEKNVSMLPNAISEETYQTLLANKQIKTPVVFYCTVGYRSGLATRKAIKHGIVARNLPGGILSWIANQGEVVDAEKRPSKQVHVYGSQWAVVPAGFEAVY